MIDPAALRHPSRMQDLRYSVFGTIGQSLAVWVKNLLSIFVLGLIFFSPLRRRSKSVPRVKAIAACFVAE